MARLPMARCRLTPSDPFLLHMVFDILEALVGEPLIAFQVFAGVLQAMCLIGFLFYGASLILNFFSPGGIYSTGPYIVVVGGATSLAALRGLMWDG